MDSDSVKKSRLSNLKVGLRLVFGVWWTPCCLARRLRGLSLWAWGGNPRSSHACPRMRVRQAGRGDSFEVTCPMGSSWKLPWDSA
eukprot:scaffold279_cov229-Pinguiococcus_pyrenoidosus.AAC.9